jgi:hypothetical protein
MCRRMLHKREEAERAIRGLALDWMDDGGYEPRPGHYPSFRTFTKWLEDRELAHYLSFRSRLNAPRAEAEGWFESAIKSYLQGHGGGAL